MATINRKLGKHLRLYVANVPEPDFDVDYTRCFNENSLTIKGTADLQENSTKEAGKINNPGDISWEISGDFNQVFDDPGLALIEDSLNIPTRFQIVDTSRSTTKLADTVWMEGEFILSDIEYQAESTDVVSGSITLKNSSEITRNRPSRPLRTAP